LNFLKGSLISSPGEGKPISSLSFSNLMCHLLSLPFLLFLARICCLSWSFIRNATMPFGLINI
jgi:hypothetical protein